MSTLALTRRRTSLWGIVALLSAALTGLAVYSYLSWLRAQVPVSGRLVSMVVASRDLDPGTALDEDSVELADHPERYLPVGTLSDLRSALGKVLTVPVFEGEAITSRKVGAKGGLSSIVPPGMRAFTLPVSSGLGFVPQPGDRVDVIVTLPREVLGEPTSVTTLQAREIAAVGSQTETGLGGVGERLGLDESRGGVTVTLFVTPTEAQRLAMAEALGRITLVLAPEESDDAPKPAPVRPGDLGSS
jgi:pilus assembly protein CpaB